MFSGLFHEMEPSEIAATLSCLIYDEKNTDGNFIIKNEKLAKSFSLV
jgi:superfamily II RNA helicase